MSSVRDAFLRRYATSPIHVPALERFLEAYEAGAGEDAFVLQFLEWDRACPDAEAARIVLEVLAALTDEQHRVVRLSDGAVRGAVRWMSGAVPLAPVARAAVLRNLLASTAPHDLAQATDLLESVDVAGDDELRDLARACLESSEGLHMPLSCQTHSRHE